MVSNRDGRYYVSTTGNQSSGRMSSLLESNGLIRMGSLAVHDIGDQVEVLLLDRTFEMECLDEAALLTKAA